MLRRSGRVRRPPRWLFPSTSDAEYHGQAGSRDALHTDNPRGHSTRDQGWCPPNNQKLNNNAEGVVKYGNDDAQQQAVFPAASLPLMTAERQPAVVISQIEEIFVSIATAIREHRELSIPYRRVRNRNDNNSWIKFPGRSVSEARLFARVLRILEMSHQALVTGNIVTKRNIFYQDKDLFRDQSTVDRLVDDIALTLGVGRHSLNITAAGKGLIIGPISFVLNDGSIVSCDNMRNEGTLVFSTESLRQIDFPSARWVLIIEKEATFRTLASSQFFRNSRAGPGVMITASRLGSKGSGKGYPDLNTRKLVHCLRDTRPRIPIYTLVDYDPDGIRILRTYKHGSSSLEHERKSSVISIHWIGIRFSDIKQHYFRPCNKLLPDVSSQPMTETNSILSAGKQQGYAALRQKAFEANTSQLTIRDRKLAFEVVKKLSSTLEREDEHEEYLYELQLMLVLNVKAEIQAVDNLGDITNWLDHKLSSEGMNV